MAHPCMKSLQAASVFPADSNNLVIFSSAHGRTKSPATFPKPCAHRFDFPGPSLFLRSTPFKESALEASQKSLGCKLRSFGAESPPLSPADATPEVSTQSEKPRASLPREGFHEPGHAGEEPHGGASVLSSSAGEVSEGDGHSDMDNLKTGFLRFDDVPHGSSDSSDFSQDEGDLRSDKNAKDQVLSRATEQLPSRTELPETPSEQQGSSFQEANGSAAQVSPVGVTDMTAPGNFPGKISGSGLLWSPTTGGVQSATSSHGLPDEAVAVRNLVAQSKQAHLCTVMSRMHHRRSGYPFASTVDFANDASGHPILSLSSLAIHARNLLADPRCTLVVQIPGWSGLADARVTIFGDVYPVPSEHQDWAKKIFASRHRQEASEQWGNRYFFRMNTIRDIYFVGGFGTVAWIDAKEYVSVQPDRIASEDSETTLQILNSTVAGRLREALAALVKDGAPSVNSVAFIAVDGKGVDIRVTQGDQSHVQRLSFPCPYAVETVEEAKAALDDMLSMGSLPSGLVDHQM